MPSCRNTVCAKNCHPHYFRKFDGYCLECMNAGVPDLMEEVERLRAQIAGHCERIAAAHEIIGKRAERPWTAEPPTVAGWYWLWQTALNRVWGGVYVSDEGIAHFAGSWQTAASMNGYLWSGPLTPPPTPTGSGDAREP